MAEKQKGSVETLREQTKGIRTAMMTTVALDGSLHSRPMAVQEIDNNGDVWFFSSKTDLKSDEIEKNNQINLTFADQDDNRYVTLSGKAFLTEDKAKVDELWTIFASAWFKDGKDDPDLVLIKVETDLAEYWNSSGSFFTQTVAFVKSLVSDKQPDVGEHGTLNL